MGEQRCSGIKGRLQDVASFQCAVSAGSQVVPARLERQDVGDMCLECVSEFCYLGEMIGAGGSAEAS